MEPPKRVGKYPIGGKSMLIGFAIAIGSITAFFVFFAIPQTNDSAAQEELMAHSEKVAYHHHVTVLFSGLDVQRPPEGIGIKPELWAGHRFDSDGISGYAPIHVHDKSGILHIESKSGVQYTLGDFFEIWGKDMNSIKVVYVDHMPYYPSDNLPGLPLRDRSDFKVEFG